MRLLLFSRLSRLLLMSISVFIVHICYLLYGAILVRCIKMSQRTDVKEFLMSVYQFKWNKMHCHLPLHYAIEWIGVWFVERDKETKRKKKERKRRQVKFHQIMLQLITPKNQVFFSQFKVILAMCC